MTQADRGGAGRSAPRDRHPEEDPGQGGPAGQFFGRSGLRETRDAWPGLSAYERFEQIVSLVLTVLIGLVIVAALVGLTSRVLTLVVFGLLDPTDPSVFQAIFGMIFTVLIALEFNHSIIGVLHRRESVIRVQTVVLIALLALCRKFIILDASETEPLTIFGLAAAILALGTVHWLVRDQDRKDTAGQTLAGGSAPPSSDQSGPQADVRHS